VTSAYVGASWVRGVVVVTVGGWTLLVITVAASESSINRSGVVSETVGTWGMVSSSAIIGMALGAVGACSLTGATVR
jgi:ABC-type phosphate transport system permease subunit